METIDLTAYRPKDSWDLLAAWRKAGLFCLHRTQPYLVNVSMNNSASLTGPNGASYRPSASVELHFKRSDKAAVHSFGLHINYITEQGLGYRLIMNSHLWGYLNAVPVDFPDIFPNRGESVYDELLYVYTEFWRAFVRPFVGVRHEELHGDNPDSGYELSCLAAN